MKVRAEATDYSFSEGGKLRQARGYALVSEFGKPLFVGLFASEAKAAEFCKAKGWKFTESPA